MAMTSQQATPSIATEGRRPACDKCKRKVVDNAEVEHSCKFKADPVMMKATLEIDAMR